MLERTDFQGPFLNNRERTLAKILDPSNGIGSLASEIRTK